MLTARNILLLLFFLSGTRAYNQLSQISQVEGLSANLISKVRTSSSEKIFVQTDKYLYNTGEKIWFKVYCLNSLTGKPIYTSKTLFIDLVNDKDSMITQLLLHNESGSTDGYIILPSYVASGYYWLRSYSKSMLQNNINTVFVTPVYIHNSFRQDGDKIVMPHWPPSVENTGNSQSRLDLFPEGGSIIAGINCVIAFRAYDKEGNPAEITGYVTDNRDSVTTKFQTAYPGLGKFNFEVWANRKYTIHIKDKDREEFTYPLPALKQSSAQLAVTGQNNEGLNVQVALGDSIYSKNYVTYLLCVSGDSLCFAATGKGMYGVAIPKKDIPAGKATLLLFNEKQQIISERNIYINRNNDVSIDIKPDKNNYQARDKVKLAVTVTGPGKEVESALLSLAVTSDSLVIPEIGKASITDLAYDDIDFPEKELPFGKIKSYSPDEWDLVMLTQKYKYRQLWNSDSISSSARNSKEDETASLKMITGKITDNEDFPAGNIFVTLFSNQQSLIVLKDTTDAKGRFRFDLPYIPEDSTLFTLKTDNGKASKLRILVDEPKLPVFKTPVNLKKNRFILSEKLIAETIKMQSDSILLSAKGRELKEVRVTTKSNVVKHSNVINGKDLAQGTNGVSNALLTMPGVQLKSGYLIIHGGTDAFRLNAASEPLVVINGVATPGEGIQDGGAGMGIGSPVLNMLDAIPVNTIDNITVLSGSEAAAYGAQGGNGVIMVTTTTKGNQFTSVSNAGYEKKIYAKTYLKPSPFPEPDYSKRNKNKAATSDYRSTIYWNGSTLTSKDGQAVYDFYTADEASVYTVTVTGVTAKGNFIYQQAKINRQ